MTPVCRVMMTPSWGWAERLLGAALRAQVKETVSVTPQCKKIERCLADCRRATMADDDDDAMACGICLETMDPAKMTPDTIAEIVTASAAAMSASSSTAPLSADDAAARGRPDGCAAHWFHCGCLLEWARADAQAPNCPFCRIAFGAVVRARDGAVLALPARGGGTADEEEEDEEDEEEQEETCAVCGDSGDPGRLLLCDGCTTGAAHTYCIGLSAVPVGEWCVRRPDLAGRAPGSEREGETWDTTGARRLFD